MNKKRVGILFGGMSCEHEVSLLSATSVLENIDREKYEPVPIGITKDGKWYLYEGDISLIKDLCPEYEKNPQKTQQKNN